MIPIAIVMSAITGFSTNYAGAGDTTVTIVVSGIGLLFLPTLLMILFREKYPRWWFDWNLQLQRFANRIGIYLLLMDDRYPSTDEEQSVHLDYPYPDAEADLGRGHAAGQVAARDPALHRAVLPRHRRVLRGRSSPGSRSCSPAATRRGCFGYVEGVVRWHNRVVGYAFALVTDRYPPFSLE